MSSESLASTQLSEGIAKLKMLPFEKQPACARFY